MDGLDTPRDGRDQATGTRRLDMRRSKTWTMALVVGTAVTLGVMGAGGVAGAHGDDEHDQQTEHDHDQQTEHDHDQQADDHGLTVHDSTGGREPTEEDEANADAFFDAVVEGIAEYADIDVAIADGYVESDGSADQTLKHYMKRGVDGAAVDPEEPSGLMYYVDDDQATLIGAVWRTRDAEPPQPGGPLTPWHDHAAQGCPEAHPDCPAADGGDPGPNVPKMLHVWTFDGARERFAHDIMGALGGDAGPGRGRGPKPPLPFDV